MTGCPLCGAADCRTFLRRSGVPVHQNLIMPDQASARAVTRGELELAVCAGCGFVFNRSFDAAKLAYGEDYDNTQSHSGYFDAYLDALVTTLVEERGLKNATIVEAGCGKGAFLRKLVAYPGSGNRGVGYDPSYAGPDSDLDGRLAFRRRYYDESCAEVQADFVVCRHVIEHVPDPLALLRAVRSALRRSPRARVFFETPCVDWILRNRVVFDFFYEHCSLFSAGSLEFAFEREGFRVDRVDHAFGGQYLWLEGGVAPEGRAAPRPAQPETVALARQYESDEAKQRGAWAGALAELLKRGRVALWGAGAKGATMANLVDPDCRLIECVVDINPQKQGRYVPGTGHAIVGPEELAARQVRSVVLMNPNYRPEVERQLAAVAPDIEVNVWSVQCG